VPFPDEPADDDGFVPPLPPEDRLWRHPSELAAQGTPPRVPTPPVVPQDDPEPRPGSGRRTGTVLVSAAAGMLLAVATLAAIGAFDSGRRQVVVEQVAVDTPDDTVPLADTVGPAIARLDVRTAGGTRTATAVVYRSDGHMLTSDHAVEGADAVAATLSDGRVVPAVVVGTDATSGVAVLRVDAGTLPTAVLGDDDRIAAGDPALAVAHAPDAAASPRVDTGRVSGTGWRVEGPDRTWHGMIKAALTGRQDDGAVLCDQTGTVVGLMIPSTTAAAAATTTDPTASATTTSVAEAATPLVDGFAMPIDYVVRVADDLVADGQAHHPWIGVEGEDLDAARATTIGRGGAAITAVDASGPAEAAGLRPGDVVLAIDTVPVGSWSALVLAVRDATPGDAVSLRFVRDGDTRVALLQVAERPAA
jgi:putative serine protease PepD